MSSVPLCVYCRRRPVEPRWRPFCSERCKMADLGRWLKGDYKIAGPSLETAEEPEGGSDVDEDAGEPS